jgi:hypothetical protein
MLLPIKLVAMVVLVLLTAFLAHQSPMLVVAVLVERLLELVVLVAAVMVETTAMALLVLLT